MKRIIFLITIFVFSATIFAQWTQLSSITDIGIVNSIDGCQPNFYLIAANSPNAENRLLISKDGGLSFTRFTNWSADYGNPSDVTVIDSLRFWIASGTKIVSTSDGGKSWQIQFEDKSLVEFFNYIEMFNLTDGVAMGDAVSSSSLTPILKTTNGGKNWTQVNTNLYGAYSADLWRRIDFVNMNTGYFYSSYPRGSNPPNPNGPMLKTTDGGKTWSSLPNTFQGGYVLKFFNESIGVAYANNITSSSNGVFVTKDGGKTWLYFYGITGGWGIAFDFVPKDASKIWFSDMNNLFFSADTGKTWQKSISSGRIRDIKFISHNKGLVQADLGTRFVTTNGGGLYTSTKNQMDIPTNFYLEQNYPNPFNPKTTIQYVIPSGAKESFGIASSQTPRDDNYVTLKVFDVLGREVATLVNEEKSVGEHTVQFNGSHLASGMYLYQINIGHGRFIQNKKMMLVK
ncbi:MAG: hypothetical protein FD143_616 [Ignavibacteria bacterium]|nr:MAG: hypothetical protein FD143_616 [Ignavibacteria bacterium]KAF0161446.1 MAG: hypothetical protein FD188_817 [Ignavibacteria bacterium]